MSLRTRAILIVTGCTVLVLGALAAFDRFVVAREFDAAERQEVRRDVLRSINAIDVEAEVLDVLLRDWAAWDDTYAFLAGELPTYVERNIPPDLVDTMLLSAVVIVDLNGETAVSQARTIEGEDGPIGDLTVAGPTRDLLLRRVLTSGGFSGILPLDEGPILIAARPVIRTNETGPPRGMMIMARWLDEAFAERLQRNLATPLTIAPVSADLPDGLLGDLMESRWAGHVLTEGDRHLGYGLLHTIDDEPALVIRTAQEREIGALSRRVFMLSLIAVGATGILLAGAILGGIEWYLLRPMLRLRREVDAVRDAAGGRVSVLGGDEVARMAQGINEMLDRLAAATSEQARLTLLATDQQQLAETALAEMSDGLLAFGADGTCSVCNPAAGRLLGLHPTRALGRHFTELLPGLSRVAADAAAGPQLVEMNGRTVAVTRNSQGTRARSSVAVLRDVTEILDVERMKRDIIGTVSHELRTPLTAIRATVDLFGAGDAGELTDVQQRMVLLLGRNVDRLAHIVNDLLDLTSLESGRVTLDHSAVDMAAACERVAEDLRPAATVAEIEISVDASTAVAWADAGRIRQVLENLIQNAIKFSRPGGHVRLSAVRDGAEVVVRVQDEGIGIPVDEQAHVFEKFYRTRAGARVAQGTGLGLPITRLIVEMHGGHIHVESDGTHGTTMVFTLPAEPPAAAIAGV
ncbi:MAG: CHASE4 domain-containing protein [Dehalococcoidia bacterium]|nr:CHASE4 domain-containing protein [Dehalococcoidia bacterium]